MNTPTPSGSFLRVIGTALLSLFALAGSLLAQVTPGGTLGDTARFFSSVGGESLDAAAGAGLLGPDFAHTFDTTIGAAGATYALNPTTTDATEIALSAGRHLVLYNAQFVDDIPTDGTNRTEVQSKLNLAGGDLVIGRSQGYTRDLSGADETVLSGGGIISVDFDDDILKLVSFRSDANTGQDLARVAGATAIQLVKLDDSWDFLALSKAANDVATVGTTATPVTWDTIDTNTGTSYAFTAGSDAVQFTQTGVYLVFANTGLEKPNDVTRTNYRQRLTLDGNVLPGTTTTTYIRGNANGEDANSGVVAIGTLVNVTAVGQELNVELSMEAGGSAAVVTGGNTALTIVKLPLSADYIALSDMSQQPINDSNPVTFGTQLTPSSGLFSFTPGGSAVTVNQTGDYLFLGNLFAQDDTTNDNADRVVVNHGWQINGGGLLAYGQGASYLRDNGGNYTAGSWCGGILSVTAGDSVEMVTRPLANTGEGSEADDAGLIGLSITSLVPSTDPTIVVNTGLAMEVSTSATITSAMLLTEDADNTADELTYLVTSNVTGGTLNHSIDGPLAIGGEFTQDDIDNNRISFDAGATPGVGFGFSFEVTDPSAIAEASGTFAIAIGVPMVLAADTGSTDEDTSVGSVDPGTSSVLTNDTGTDLNVVAFDAVSAQGALVNVNAAGDIIYDPSGSATLQSLDDGDSILDSFDYTVRDYTGAEATETVTMTVSGVNDVPVVNADSFTGTDISIRSGNLLANDTDADATDVLAISGFAGGGIGTVITPEGATVTIAADGSFVYDPSTSATISALPNGASITEFLSYDVTDGTATVSGTVTVVSLGTPGASNDVETVAANGTANLEVLNNDTIGGAAGAPVAGAAYEFLASTAGNTDSVWNYTGAAGTLTSATTLNGGIESILNLSPANAPPGVSAVYQFSGTSSGLPHEDLENAVLGAVHTTDSTVELVFRPSAQTGTQILWETGGDGTGSSIVMIDNKVVVTITGNNGADAAQVVGYLSAGAVAGGDFVHVLALIDTDPTAGVGTVELFVNNVSYGTSSMVDLATGAALPLNDYSGTDNGGIGVASGSTIGGNIAQLGAFGTIPLPAPAVPFAGEFASARVYSSLLDPSERLASYEAVFGVTGAPVATDVIDLAGTPNPVAGSTVVTLPSGAQVTFESDGSFTYDPNGAFDHIGLGLTATDTFTYTIAGQPNATATVTMTINGVNPNPQINIAADQTSVTEGAGADFTLTSTAALSGPVTVNLSFSGEAQSGSDFSGSASVLINSTPAAFSLTTIDDGIFEGAENVVVTIGSVTGDAVVGATFAAETLIDDAQSAPVITIAADQGSVTEGSPATFTISSDQAADEPVTIGLVYSGTATEGIDYVAETSVVLPANDVSVTLLALALHDLVADSGEVMTVTVDTVSIGSIGGAASANTTINDGVGEELFSANFEGVVVSPSTGLNAEIAANEGTQVGSWTGVPTITTTGSDPGVIPETDDGKGDGADSALLFDRPFVGGGEVSALFEAPADFSGANSAVIAFDIGQIRTQDNSFAKSARIIGLDENGEKSFELFLGANNTAPNNEQLFHVDSLGTLTPVGSPSDFENTQNTAGAYAEGSLSRVRLALTSLGYVISIDRYVIDGIPESTTALLPYAGNATQVSEIRFSIPTSLDDTIAGGIILDDISAIGIRGNQTPRLTLDGASLADAASTAIVETVINKTRVFDSAGNSELQISDPDATSVTLRLQAVNGLGTISVSLQPGASGIAGANGSADLTIGGSVAGINSTLAAGVSYTSGAVGGSEILRVTVDDGGSAGAGGAKSVSHDLTFQIFEDPTVTINQDAGQTDPALAGPIVFNVTFSEPVQGFDNGATDVDLSASTASGTLVASITEVAPNDGSTYSVSVSGMTGSGTVVASVPAGAAQRPGSLEDNVESSSTDNVVEYIQNVAPALVGGSQGFHYASGTTAMPLLGLAVDDPNHVTQSTIATALTPFVDYPAVDPASFTSIDPVNTDGLTIEVKFTPDVADVAIGGIGSETRRTVFNIGGSSNGSGIYLIEGIPYFISKMDSAAVSTSVSLNDPDWDATAGDEMIVIPLSSTPLLAGVPAYVTVIFGLETIQYSVNGEAPTTVILLNRAANNNWAGDNTIRVSTVGGPGGLSSSAGLFDETTYLALGGVQPVEYARMWNAFASGISIEAVDRPETVTATLTIDGYVDDATSGSLTALSGNGETYSNGVWTVTGQRDVVNAALADVNYIFGSSVPNPGTISVAIEDGDEDGGGVTTEVIVISEFVGTVVYVDDDFSGVGGSAIADADLSVGNGAQPGVFLSNCFTNLTDALAAVTDTVTIIVNDGDYGAENIALTGTMALRLANTAGPVRIGDIVADLNTAIDLQGNTLEIGATNLTTGGIKAEISGAGGNLTKVGTGRVTTQAPTTYSGTTTVLDGILRIGQNVTLDPSLQSDLGGAGPVTVTDPGRLEFNVAPGNTINQTGLISGTGSVGTLSDGTLVFNGPSANTFSGGFELGDGASTTFDGSAGAIQGFVVVNNSGHLGTGKILSRGSQLQAGTSGIVIPNAIDVTGGGFRVGGAEDIVFSGPINPIDNAVRGFGNYGLDGLDLTVTGPIDVSAGTMRVEGTNGADNGSWTFTGNITGTNPAYGVEVWDNFDGGETTFSGNHTYAGATLFRSGVVNYDVVQTGGAAFTVQTGTVLNASGSTESAVTVQAGATLSPGPGPAVFSTGSLTLAGTLLADVNGTATPGTDYDQIAVTGSVDLTGSDLVLTLGSLTGSGIATLIDNDDDADQVTGSFFSFPEGVLDSTYSGWDGAFTYFGGDDNDVQLAFNGYTIIGSWRLANFGSSENGGSGANGIDANSNGFTNLADFAFGFDPAAAGSSGGRLRVGGGAILELGGPTVRFDSNTGRAYLLYPRRTDYVAAGLIYREDFSLDLSIFTPGVGPETVVATGTGDGGVPLEVVQIEFPTGLGAPAAFARVFIELP